MGHVIGHSTKILEDNASEEGNFGQNSYPTADHHSCELVICMECILFTYIYMY